MLIDRATMMLLNRFNILYDIDELRMIIVLVYRYWRVINCLCWAIGTKLGFTHARYIGHIVVVITVQSVHLLPVLEYTLLYSHRGVLTCALDIGDDSLLCSAA